MSEIGRRSGLVAGFLSMLLNFDSGQMSSLDEGACSVSGRHAWDWLPDRQRRERSREAGASDGRNGRDGRQRASNDYYTASRIRV
jgi:hypothetical protein